MLSGETDNGKTYALLCIAKRLIVEGHRSAFVNHQELMTAIKSTYGSGSRETYKEVVDKVLRSYLVILDEIGVGNVASWMIDRTYEIIDALYRNGKPMLAATNLTKDQIARYFEDPRTVIDRITPRIFEHSPMQYVAPPTAVRQNPARRRMCLMD